MFKSLRSVPQQVCGPLLLSTALAIAAPAQALTVFAVTTENNLISFDSATPGTLISDQDILGLNMNGEDVLAFDIHPFFKDIYLFTDSFQLYRLDQAGLDPSLVPIGTPFGNNLFGSRWGTDIRDARLFGNIGQMFAINDAERNAFLVLASGGMVTSAGFPPGNIVEIALSRNYPNPDVQELFGIDSDSDMLVLINRGGRLITPVGPVGVDFEPNSALEFSGSTLFALLRFDGSTQLVTLDPLTGGIITNFGEVEGNPVIVGMAMDYEPISQSKISVKLNFAQENKDAISVSGVVYIPPGFAVAGKEVILNVGGVEKSFILDAKGKAKAGSDSFKLTVKSRNGVVAEQRSPFKASLKNGNFAEALADDGLLNENVSNAPRQIPVTLQYGDDFADVVQGVLYTGKLDKSGKAKN